MVQHRRIGPRMLMVLACALATPRTLRAEPCTLRTTVVDHLHQCFRDAAQKASENSRAVPFGPGSETFFFEQLGAAMQLLGEAPAQDWCEPWFVAPYVRAYRALEDAQGRERVSHAVSMPLSSGVHQAPEARLLTWAARMGGTSHLAAHAEMMRHALGTPQVARELNRLRLGVCARGLLLQAVQVPDLYLYGEPLWHAHTHEPQDLQTPPAERHIEADRAAFVALVAQTVHEGQRAHQEQRIDRAMLLFGAAAHAVQDLNFHRGMTPAEQAALTYVMHSNPDWPEGDAYGRVAQRATQQTAQLLAQALGALAPIEAAAVGLEHESAEALATAAQATWPEALPLSYETLRTTYIDSEQFMGSAQGVRRRLSQAHLGRWAIAPTFDEILAAL